MKKHEMLFLIISMFTLTVLWIAFSVYHNFVTSTIPEGQAQRIAPITPNFDTKVIEQLKKREKLSAFTQIQITSAPSPIATVQATLTPTPQITTPTPSSTPSGSLTPTP